MICEQCKETGQRSRVYPGGSTSTLMMAHPYYDEDGVYHENDPNISTQYFSCSNRHRWSSVTQHGATIIERLEPAEAPPDTPFLLGLALSLIHI